MEKDTCGCCITERKCPDGAWIKYDDYADRIEQLEAENERAKAIAHHAQDDRRDMRIERDNLEAKVEQQAEQIKQLAEERDLAIAHDRQPYPTAQAYEKTCILLREAREQITELQANLAKKENQYSQLCRELKANR